LKVIDETMSVALAFISGIGKHKFFAWPWLWSSCPWPWPWILELVLVSLTAYR